MIEQLHEIGIVFRDLKPENIMLEYNTARLKLVDFGFSKVLHSSRTYTKCGTLAYSAPEILQQSDSSPIFNIDPTRKYSIPNKTSV